MGIVHHMESTFDLLKKLGLGAVVVEMNCGSCSSGQCSESAGFSAQAPCYGGGRVTAQSGVLAGLKRSALLAALHRLPLARLWI